MGLILVTENVILAHVRRPQAHAPRPRAHVRRPQAHVWRTLAQIRNAELRTPRHEDEQPQPDGWESEPFKRGGFQSSQDRENWGKVENSTL